MRSRMPGEGTHTPVLVAEVVRWLAAERAREAIDATIDGGGHARALLERMGPRGRLLGIDRDPELIAIARRELADAVERGCLVLVHGNFRELGRIAAKHRFPAVDAVLFDLGMSSFHLDASGRGFSFGRDEPLDMRFDPSDRTAETAARILATRSAEELAALFREYGEERFAARIARAVVAARKAEPVATSRRLFDLVVRALPSIQRPYAARSAARIFQALRIAANAELEAVREALPQAVHLLRPGGRLAVIAFHSLEDRLVKRFLVEQQRAGVVRILTKRPLRASDEEVAANPRAASARLRAAERVA